MTSTNANNSLTEAVHCGMTLWIGAQTLTLVNFFLVAYTFACFLRYGLRKEKFCWRTPTTINSSSNHGGCTAYKIAFVFFSLCLLSVALTQLQLIIDSVTSNIFTTTTTTNTTTTTITTNTTPNTTTNAYNASKVVFVVGKGLQFVLDLLLTVYTWHGQRSFYKRAAVKHLRTIAFEVVEWCTFVFMLTLVGVIYQQHVPMYQLEHNVCGCVFSVTSNQFVRSLIIMVMAMMLGLFLYAFYETKRSKTQPASEGLAVAVMHRAIKRYTFCVILSIIGKVSAMILVDVLVNQPLYVYLVVNNIGRIVQGLAVALTMEDRRKIML